MKEIRNEEPSGLNTNIYKNSYNQYIADLSFVGVAKYTGDSVNIYQVQHNLQEGDVLFYDIKNKVFDKAIAINAIDSEVCGIISEVIDSNNFIMSTGGYIRVARYNFELGKTLYLSESIPGSLTSIPPTTIVKEIATQTYNGIIIDIQRGYKISNIDIDFSVEPYTQEELDEIIKNIW